MVVMAVGIKLLEVDFGLRVSTNFGQMGFFWGCCLHFSRSQYFLDSHKKNGLIKKLYASMEHNLVKQVNNIGWHQLLGYYQQRNYA